MKSPFLFFRVLAAVFISLAVLFSVSFAPLSCSMGGAVYGDAGSGWEKSDYSAMHIKSVSPPQLESFTVDSSETMLLCFDKSVSICDASLCSAGGSEAISVSSETGGDGSSVKLRFDKETAVGTGYELHAVAKDDEGNSLSFSLSFDAFNPRIPDLLLCELRNAYSSKKNKYEFIRLYCAKAGNLSGLELLSAGDGAEKAFVFPPVEVEAGDYVCVHLRKMKDEAGNWKQEGMLDEDSGDRKLSFAVDSSDEAWDFWQDNQKSRLSPSDIVILRNRMDGRVLDAFLFRDPKKNDAAWNDTFQPLCTAVAASGRWLDAGGQVSASFEAAFVAEGITSSAVTRSMKRRNLESHPSSAADWYVEQSR